MHVRILHRQDLEELGHSHLARVVCGVSVGEGARDLNRAGIYADDCRVGVAGRKQGLGEVEAAFDVDLDHSVSCEAGVGLIISQCTSKVFHQSVPSESAIVAVVGM